MPVQRQGKQGKTWLSGRKCLSKGERHFHFSFETQGIDQLADDRQNIMDKAETRFLETQKKNADKARAMNEYQTEARLRAQKTAKLRELRLAREEADRAAEALKPAPVKQLKTASVKKTRAPRTAAKDASA